VTETLLTEVKQTAEVTKSTLGLDKVGNYGGSIDRALRTADRLKNTSNTQLQAEFQAIMEGDAVGNLKTALYTTSSKISNEAKDVFNYVYVAAANGTVTAVKSIEIFTQSTIGLPFLIVPYFLFDPKNSPMYNPEIDA